MEENIVHERINEYKKIIDNRIILDPSLNLSNLSIRELPSVLFSVPNVERLLLSGNELQELSSEIGKFRTLSLIDLSNNNVTKLPKEFGNLVNLIEIDLRNNGLEEFPSSILDLQNLEKLDLRNNNINQVPAKIKNLKSLKHFVLDGNGLSSLPEEIYSLKSLEGLYLHENKLEILSENIIKLENLRNLDISNNKFISIPKYFCDLPNLYKLRVSNNSIVIPEPEIYQESRTSAFADIEAIRGYYKAREEGVEKVFEAKILIVGEPGAGKTSLAKKILDHDFALIHDEASTKGIDILRWRFELFDDTEFKVNIWDFGGQEIYQSTHQFFLTKRSFYLLVSDARKENTDFDYWLNIQELLGGDSPVIIVQNEIQDRKRHLPISEFMTSYPNLLMRPVQINLSDNRGLKNIVTIIKQQLETLPHVGMEWPIGWNKVRALLDEKSSFGINYIDLEEYFEICKENGFKNEKDMLLLSRFLHDLGVIIHFQDDHLLRRLLILRPEWGTEAVYKVLDDPDVKKSFGKFNSQTLAQIWSDEKNKNKIPELLRLMINFNLCYQVPLQEEYVIPQLLPLEHDEYHWDKQDNLVFEIHYQFMPQGILPRLIVAMQEEIKDQRLVWRYGVLVQINDAEAEVIENYKDRYIRIRVSGQQYKDANNNTIRDSRKELLGYIYRELTNINSLYQKINITQKIPCNCEKCIKSENPYMFNLDDLERRLEHNKFEIECGNPPFDTIEIIPMLRKLLDISLFDFNNKRLFENIRNQPGKDIDKFQGIYISYAWSKDAKKLNTDQLVSRIEREFHNVGIRIKRDQNELTYKDSIKSFMDDMGKGNGIIVVINDKYLKSPFCMYELVQIAKTGEFRERIFPIVLDDTSIFNPPKSLEYVRYWEEKLKEFDTSLKEVTGDNIGPYYEMIDDIREIRSNIANLMNVIRDMNVYTVEEHLKTEFQDLIEAVKLIL